MKEKKNLLRKAVVAVIVLVILIPCSVLVLSLIHISEPTRPY